MSFLDRKPLSPATTDPDQAAWTALRFLATADARLAALIRSIGPHRPKLTRDPFHCLSAAITQQQVSMTAAAAVFRRLKSTCPHGRLSPRGVMAQTLDELRTVGLSRQKAVYVHELAAVFADRTLTRAKLERMSDEEVLAAVTRIKGIGRWTAEMLLIFCLGRTDVWPIDDLGLRKAVRTLLGRAEFLSREEMLALAEPWRPYRTYATWYLWRSLEGPQMTGVAIRETGANTRRAR